MRGKPFSRKGFPRTLFQKASSFLLYKLHKYIRLANFLLTIINNTYIIKSGGRKGGNAMKLKISYTAHTPCPACIQRFYTAGQRLLFSKAPVQL